MQRLTHKLTIVKYGDVQTNSEAQLLRCSKLECCDEGLSRCDCAGAVSEKCAVLTTLTDVE